MAVTKETVVDKIEVLEDGFMQVRRARYFLEDGVRSGAPEFKRVAYHPGADVSQETARVRAIAQVVWTPQVIAAWEAAEAARQAARRGPGNPPPA